MSLSCRHALIYQFLRSMTTVVDPLYADLMMMPLRFLFVLRASRSRSVKFSHTIEDVMLIMSFSIDLTD